MVGDEKDGERGTQVIKLTGGVAVKTHFGFTSQQLDEDGWNVATCLLDAINSILGVCSSRTRS